MSNIEEIEELTLQILNIEKESMQKRFEVASGNGERYSSNKADAVTVSKIVNLLEDGEK